MLDVRYYKLLKPWHQQYRRASRSKPRRQLAQLRALHTLDWARRRARAGSESTRTPWRAASAVSSAPACSWALSGAVIDANVSALPREALQLFEALFERPVVAVQRTARRVHAFFCVWQRLRASGRLSRHSRFVKHNVTHIPDAMQDKFEQH